MFVKKTYFFLLISSVLLIFSCKNHEASSSQNEKPLQSRVPQHDNTLQKSQVLPSWKETRHEKDSNGLTKLREFSWDSYRVISHSDGESVDFGIYYKDKSLADKSGEQQILYIHEGKESNLQGFDVIDSVLDLQKNGKKDLVACTFSYGNSILANNYLIELDRGQAKVFERLNFYGCLNKDQNIVDLNGDGIFELVLRDMNYGGRFSGDWPEDQGFDIPAPELVFEWDASSTQYLLSKDLMKKRISLPENLQNQIGEIRKAPQWSRDVVPVEAMQQALTLMFVGQEAQAWKFLNDSAPPGKIIPPAIIDTLRRLRDKDYYWLALKNNQPATLKDFKF